jgi:hypothetical protein
MPVGGIKRVKMESELSSKAKEAVKSTVGRKDSKKKQEEESGNSSGEESDDKEYEVEGIDGHKVSKANDEIEFYVKWKNYPRDENTWESFEFFAQDAPEMAQKYLANLLNLSKVPKKV